MRLVEAARASGEVERDASPPSPAQEPIERAGGVKRLVVHVAAVAVALGVVAALIGPGSFTVDERAYTFQAEVARSGAGIGPGGWGLPYPEAVISGAGLGAPLGNAGLGESAWYPYVSHPFYVELVGLAQRIAGDVGPIGLGIVSVLVAAAAMELLATGRFGAPPFVTLWFVGVLSPVSFHGFVAWAHAPALAALAVALALAARPQRGFEPAVIALCVFAAVLLRSEAPLAAGGIAIVVLGQARIDLEARVRHLANFAAVCSATVVGVFVDGWWSTSISGELAVLESTSRFDVISNANSILLQPGREPISVLRLVAVGLFVLSAMWIGRDRVLSSILTVGAVGAGLAGSTASSAYVGFVVAAPVIILGVAMFVATRNESARPDEFRLGMLLVGGAALAVVGAIAASPSGGGGTGWGGRYVLHALVFVIPVAVGAVSWSWQHRPETRSLLIGVVMVTLAIQVSGVRTLQRTHAASETVSVQLQTALPNFAERVDVILTSDPRTGRLAPETASTLPIIAVRDDDDLLELLGVVDQPMRVGIVGIVEPLDLAPIDGWTEIDVGNDTSLQFVILEWTS